MVSIKQVHHGYWKEPLAFRPDRFLPGGEYEQFPDDMRPFVFIPFSAGPRNCLGQYLSLVSQASSVRFSSDPLVWELDVPVSCVASAPRSRKPARLCRP